MPGKSEVLARAAALRAGFEAVGAVPVETAVLQSADMLLDLYGEAIRGRAYVTSDALRGELMLRPDFTIPVVQMHMSSEAESARYTYAGEVFRKQEDVPERAIEYIQVGFEVFGGDKPAASEAEVFSRIHASLGGLPLRAATGDIGLLAAAVEGLNTSAARKEALKRHIWRPQRFRGLLDRYGRGVEVSASRVALLVSDEIHAIGHESPEVGKRTRADVESRIATLREDARTSPISETELAALEALLAVQSTLPRAVGMLRDVASELRGILPVIERMESRLDALASAGISVDEVDFEASYGRTTMEYYDGFVFGFYTEGRPDLPPVATGGRYDALTRRLGRGRGIPAVGGVLRPELMLHLEESLQ